VPELTDRTAVVTGASSGLGAQTARALATAGARLALGARRTDRLEELMQELPGEGHEIAPLDVTDEASCASFVATAAGALGRIDILVNNAGLALGRTSVEESNDDDDRQMLETNVLGLVRMTQVMRKELVGRIKVSTVDPGMVGDTEFSDVRFRGDQERKGAVYRGVDYLTPADVADCILFAVTRPDYMVVDEMVIKPLQQASQDSIVRR
jgi:3-hydroxy acid dehydrogenase / malonic semialdehyde reductase